MASMPELGSKISLISKSDIRYEGQLYTVDPNECTIALANVRSYGTEDRDGQFAIPPQEEIFDYILFRGSDIKDIRVVNNVPRVPHDPAIMQMHVSNQPNNFQPQFSMPVMPHAGGPLGPFGGGNNQPGPFNALSTPNAQGGQLPQGTPGLPFGQQQQSQQSQQQQQTPQQQSAGQQQQQQNNQQPQKNSVLDLITGGSRSTTPVSLNSRKSPTAEMGVQVNQKDGTRRNNNRGQQGGRLDSQGSHENRNQQSRNNQYQGNNQNRGGSNWVNRNQNQNVRNNQHQRPQRRGPGIHPQSFRQNQNSKGRPQPKTTIKFESDFDFEQANTKFEEVRLSLAKLKVGEEAKPEQVNGEAEKKDDSGNETGAGEQEQEDDEVTLGYDKTKSFFDNISCEAATDRKGKNRTDWRLERKLNSETFGVSSARRGGYFNYNRGRPGGQNGGSYFNNNRNMGYRNNGYNGNNGGYRGGNFRNNNPRNFNNQRNQNQGNNQQENPTTSLPQEKQPSTQQSQSTAAQAPAVTAGGK